MIYGRYLPTQQTIWNTIWNRCQEKGCDNSRFYVEDGMALNSFEAFFMGAYDSWDDRDLLAKILWAYYLSFGETVICMHHWTEEDCQKEPRCVSRPRLPCPAFERSEHGEKELFARSIQSAAGRKCTPGQCQLWTYGFPSVIQVKDGNKSLELIFNTQHTSDCTNPIRFNTIAQFIRANEKSSDRYIQALGNLQNTDQCTSSLHTSV
ncbi:hypothetical protein BDV3_006442 [Batrachochytrium dendrobatidis]